MTAGSLVLGDLSVGDIGEDAVDAVRRERGEFVLCGHPAALGVLLCGDDDEGSVTEVGQRLCLVHRSAQLGELVADAAAMTGGRPEPALFIASRLG